MRIVIILIIFSFIVSGDHTGLNEMNAVKKQEIAIYCKETTGNTGNRSMKPALKDSLIDYMILEITSRDHIKLSPGNHILHSLYVNEVDK
jgi:hypothetical protein